jgi:hypothetical protein
VPDDEPEGNPPEIEDEPEDGEPNEDLGPEVGQGVLPSVLD